MGCCKSKPEQQAFVVINRGTGETARTTVMVLEDFRKAVVDTGSFFYLSVPSYSSCRISELLRVPLE